MVARMVRPDILWAVNILAREVTKWTVACDKRLHKLMGYLLYTKDWRQISYVRGPIDKCALARTHDKSVM